MPHLRVCCNNYGVSCNHIESPLGQCKNVTTSPALPYPCAEMVATLYAHGQVEMVPLSILHPPSFLISLCLALLFISPTSCLTVSSLSRFLPLYTYASPSCSLPQSRYLPFDLAPSPSIPPLDICNSRSCSLQLSIPCSILLSLLSYCLPLLVLLFLSLCLVFITLSMFSVSFSPYLYLANFLLNSIFLVIYESRSIASLYQALSLYIALSLSPVPLLYLTPSIYVTLFRVLSSSLFDTSLTLHSLVSSSILLSPSHDPAFLPLSCVLFSTLFHSSYISFSLFLPRPCSLSIQRSL